MPDEAPAPTAANRENRRTMTDDQVIGRFLENLPPDLRAPLRPLIVAVMKRERARCTDILQDGVRYHEARVKQVEGLIQSAVMAETGATDLVVRRACEISCLRSIAAALRAINIPPGACSTCNGTQLVPAAVVLPGGQVPMVPCPSCAPSPAANGTTSSGAAKTSEG